MNKRVVFYIDVFFSASGGSCADLRPACIMGEICMYFGKT